MRVKDKLDEIGAAFEYQRTGDVEYLARYLEKGGAVTEETRPLIVHALRGIKPRKRSKAQRDAKIVSSMKLIVGGGWDGQKYSVEEARAMVAEAYHLSEAAIKKVWDARPG